jgi:hypothetical protein
MALCDRLEASSAVAVADETGRRRRETLLAEALALER